MAVTYDASVKAARMLCTRDYFAGGSLEILASTGTILACFDLSPSGGEVRDEVWNLDFVSKSVIAEASGIPSAAQMKTASGAVCLTGLTVGKNKDITLSYSDKSEQRIHAGQDVNLTAAAIVHA